MVAKLVNCDSNTFTFIYALPFNAKLGLEIDEEVNGGINIEVDYSSYMMVFVLNDKM
jgi:hypothetical protein